MHTSDRLSFFFASLSGSQVDCLVNIPWCYYCHFFFFFFKHYLSTVFGQVLCSRVAFAGDFSHSMTGVFMTRIIYLVCLSLIKHHTVVLNYNSDQRKLILSSLDKTEFYVFFLFQGKQYLFCICQTILARYFYLTVGRENYSLQQSCSLRDESFSCERVVLLQTPDIITILDNKFF